MFDINYIFAQALQQAVAQAIAPLAARVTGLETSLTALENNPAIGVDTTLAAEQRTLAARVTALEVKLTEADLFTKMTNDAFVSHLDQQEWFWEKVSRFVADNSVFNADDLKTLKDRIEELESETRGENRYLNREDVDSLIEEALDSHNSDYDHDDFITSDSVKDAVRDHLEDAVSDKINDALSNATISISV